MKRNLETRENDINSREIQKLAIFYQKMSSQRVRIGNSLFPPIRPNAGTPQGTKLAPLLFCILVNGMAAKCRSRVKYVDDATAKEIIPRCSPSYLPFAVSDIYKYASLRVLRGMKFNSKKWSLTLCSIAHLLLPPLLLGVLSFKGFWLISS